MISSKTLLAATGISRATLNNYIGLGLLSKPEIRSGSEGERHLGHFPETALERVLEIKRLKASGLSMPQIVERLRGGSDVAILEEPRPSEPPKTMGQRSTGGGVMLTLDEVPHPAFMFNYRFELVWHNDAARRQLLGGFGQLPAMSDERHVLPMIEQASRAWPEVIGEDLIRSIVGLAKGRLNRDAVAATCRNLPIALQTRVMRMYEEFPSQATQTAQAAASAVLPLELPDAFGRTQSQRLIATYFREGIFVVCAPAEEPGGSLAEFLSRRDLVIRHLLKKRLPVLTPLAVLVADLQGSTRICSELPPEEYFELINEIWVSMEPIFRRYFGTHGKHVGDGMLYYFFPQPDSHYVFNALRCATELREEMRRIHSKWQHRKGWFNELLLNIGLHEGTEWLGTFQTATSIEFSALGDTINQASRLSDFARYGAIWATKSLVGKLTLEEKNRVVYGVNRRSHDGREVFVESTFAQVETLLEADRSTKLHDISGLAVTQIQSVRLSPDR
jgi:adenylate cyclase